MGLKFRRLQPIDHYIVDFFCPSYRLVIELDGMSHADRAQYDLSRQRYLEAQGLTVLRFHNDEVRGNIEGVLVKICVILASIEPLP